MQCACVHSQEGQAAEGIEGWHLLGEGVGGDISAWSATEGHDSMYGIGERMHRKWALTRTDRQKGTTSFIGRDKCVGLLQQVQH